MNAYTNPAWIWTTADECRFIDGLHRSREFPEAFGRYADLVLSGKRAYDASVDMAAVRSEILRLAGAE